MRENAATSTWEYFVHHHDTTWGHLSEVMYQISIYRGSCQIMGPQYQINIWHIIFIFSLKYIFIEVLVSYSSCISVDCLVHATLETPSPRNDSRQVIHRCDKVSQIQTISVRRDAGGGWKRSDRKEGKNKSEVRGEIGIQDDSKVSTSRDMKKLTGNGKTGLEVGSGPMFYFGDAVHKLLSEETKATWPLETSQSPPKHRTCRFWPQPACSEHDFSSTLYPLSFKPSLWGDVILP